MKIHKRLSRIQRLADECNVQITYPLNHSGYIEIDNPNGESLTFPTPRRTESFLRKLKKSSWIMLFCFIFAVGIHAQTVTVQQSFVDDANSAFKEVVALRTANDALKSENEALKKLQVANDALLTAKDTIIAAQDKRYDRLAATKCSTSSFLIFLYRTKKCF